MQYDVIRNNQLDSLISSVNRKLRLGWEPHGNLLIESFGDGNIFLQPIIKKS